MKNKFKYMIKIIIIHFNILKIYELNIDLRAKSTKIILKLKDEYYL
jgi:hypothetical protein